VILTKNAVEIASEGARRKNTRPREKMIQGLLLNGIGMQSGNNPVIQAEKLSLFILPYTAQPCFSLWNDTTVGAKLTYCTSFFFLVVFCFLLYHILKSTKNIDLFTYYLFGIMGKIPIFR